MWSMMQYRSDDAVGARECRRELRGGGFKRDRGRCSNFQHEMCEASALPCTFRRPREAPTLSIDDFGDHPGEFLPGELVRAMAVGGNGLRVWRICRAVSSQAMRAESTPAMP